MFWWCCLWLCFRAIPVKRNGGMVPSWVLLPQLVSKKKLWRALCTTRRPDQTVGQNSIHGWWNRIPTSESEQHVLLCITLVGRVIVVLYTCFLLFQATDDIATSGLDQEGFLMQQHYRYQLLQHQYLLRSYLKSSSCSLYPSECNIRGKPGKVKW